MLKFETIKAKAIQQFAGYMGQWDRLLLGAYDGHLVKGSDGAMAALLPFVLASQAEREEMRAFAQAFEPRHERDWLAAVAKGTDRQAAWSQVVLKAREAGIELIERWDVRQVGKLIELFPGCAPAKYKGKQLTVFMADNEDSDWMVTV